jgi:hypothetical protein
LLVENASKIATTRNDRPVAVTIDSRFNHLLPQRRRKAERKMQPTPQTASHPLPGYRNGSLRARPMEDVVYQIFTVAAILLVLGSLWIF